MTLHRNSVIGGKEEEWGKVGDGGGWGAELVQGEFEFCSPAKEYCRPSIGIL